MTACDQRQSTATPIKILLEIGSSLQSNPLFGIANANAKAKARSQINTVTCPSNLQQLKA